MCAGPRFHPLEQLSLAQSSWVSVWPQVWDELRQDVPDRGLVSLPVWVAEDLMSWLA